MADIELEFVNVQKDRHGRPKYQYFRRNGRRWELPEEPLSEEYMAEGKPFDETYYGSWFADAIEDAGLPDDCVVHGSARARARKLADLGLSEETIKAITGHVTSRMVAKYVKGANQRKLAKAAMKAWENGG
jgi:hypothetical protein